jgi:hypothetical protein
MTNCDCCGEKSKLQHSKYLLSNEILWIITIIAPCDYSCWNILDHAIMINLIESHIVKVAVPYGKK